MIFGPRLKTGLKTRMDLPVSEPVGVAPGRESDTIVVGAASRRDSRRGSYRVLLTPLTYIHVGDGAPTLLCQNLISGELQPR